MSVLLLVRHGQASWGAADYDQLSETGYEQARLVGRALAARGVRPTHLYAGGMRRHEQTATAALEGAGWDLPVEVDPRWDEFDHLQMLRVHEPPETEGAEMSKQEFQTYEEPFGAFTGRVDAAMDAVDAALGSGDTAVVFSSGGPISWTASQLIGADVAMWTRLNPVMVNASVTKVVLGKRGRTLVSLNEHAHLEPDTITYR